MLRIRSPQGVHTFRLQTEPPSTLVDLQMYIASVAQIPIEQQDSASWRSHPVKFGVPPRRLAQDAANSADVLQEAPLNLRAGDSVTVEASSAPASQPRSSPQVPYGNGGVLRLHTIPDDNSCLFHALSYMQTQCTSEEQSQAMRECTWRNPVC